MCSIEVFSKSIVKRSSILCQSLFIFKPIVLKFVDCSVSLKLPIKLSNVAVHAFKMILAYFISVLFVSDKEFNIVITLEDKNHWDIYQ